MKVRKDQWRGAPQSINRREFLRLCAVIGAGAILAACKAAEPTPVPTKPAAAATATSKPAEPTRPVAPTATIAAKPAEQPAAVATLAPTKEAAINLTWLGQSTFILATSSGLTALLDPMGASVGYPLTTITGVDLVTVSHEHSDHNNVGLAAGSPLVLRGLAGSDWAKIDQTVKGVRVRTVPTYHDDSQGSQRGKNAIFVFELEGLKLAHLGDLGHVLTPDQLKALGPVEVILLPVGGAYTVDGRGAAEVVGQLNPRVIVPMHYKTPALGASLAGRLAPVSDFTAALGASAKVMETGQVISLSAGKLPAERTVMVMNYQ